MIISNEIACLILLYRRTTNIEEILERCIGMGLRRFYFAIDGPRNDTERIEQDKLTAILSDFCREKNVEGNITGLRKNRGILINMVTALEYFFSKETFGIILEDDTVPRIEFVDFVRSARKTLDREHSTMIISGWRGFDSSKASNVPFEHCSYPLIWGWATTREKWQTMRTWFFEEYPNINRNRWMFDSSYSFWKTGYCRVSKGRLDSWANILAFRFRVDNLKSLVPRYTMINNVGYDEFATHSKRKITFSLRRNYISENVTLDRWLETEVFAISRRHLLSPLYAPIMDLFKGRPKRVPPLEFLRDLAAQVERPNQLRDFL